jgi:hypothetical protein
MEMPSIKKLSSGESSSRADSLSPFTEDSAGNSVESNVDEFKKPEYISAESNITSQVKIPVSVKKGIEVVATRKGFYNQMRCKEGDKFFVKSEIELGEWMKCVDPMFEKKRIEILKAKKAK